MFSPASNLIVNVRSLPRTGFGEEFLLVPCNVLWCCVLLLDERNEHRLGLLIVDFDEAVPRKLLFECGCKLD